MSPAPDIETASDGYAARFAGSAGRYLLEVQNRGVASLMSELAGLSVLDVGGGHGQLLDVYRDLGMDVTIHGSDTQCFDRLRPQAGDVRLVVSDILTLPFANRSFDVVLAVRLISHVDQWSALIAEMCRVARSCVIIDYPSKRSLNALTPLLFGLKRGFEKNTRTYTSFRHKELREVFAAEGFGAMRELKQFFIPMVIHRALGGGAVPRSIERACSAVGLTSLFGSPILLKATRRRVHR